MGTSKNITAKLCDARKFIQKLLHTQQQRVPNGLIPIGLFKSSQFLEVYLKILLRRIFVSYCITITYENTRRVS